MRGSGVSELLVIFGCCVGLLFPAIFLFFLIMALTRKSRGWIIAAVVSGILTLLLFIGGIVFAVKAGVKEAEEQARPRAFPTLDGIATVMGAPRWGDLAIGSDDATLGIGNAVKEEYLVVISEPKSDFPEGFTLSQFAEVASEQALTSVTDAEVSEFREISVGGMPALRREVSGHADGIAIFYLNSYLEGREHFHQVMAWTLLENQVAARPVLEAAADSFREITR